MHVQQTQRRTQKRLIGGGVLVLATMLALPAWGLPLWTIRGGGGGGSLGGDGYYRPFDGRFLFTDDTVASAEFLPDVTLAPLSSATGDLVITVSSLEGRAYNVPNDATNQVADGTVLGTFDYTITYTNAVLSRGEFDDYSVSVPSGGPTPGEGIGALTYVSDTLPDLPSGDGSVDGEQEGDTIVFRTPDCGFLPSTGPGSCPDAFYEWSGFLGDFSFGGNIVGFDIDSFNQRWDELVTSPGDTIPTERISLFHAGMPCGDPSSIEELFYCSPTPDLFAETSLPGSYADYVTERVAGVAIDAAITQVPEPAPMALLGAGLAGMGLARRRRRRSGAN